MRSDIAKSDPETKFVIFSKAGRGQYKKCEQYPTVPCVDYAGSQAVIGCRIERMLNNGLLAFEAEIEYPKQGKHNARIYKVRAVTKSGSCGF